MPQKKNTCAVNFPLNTQSISHCTSACSLRNGGWPSYIPTDKVIPMTSPSIPRWNSHEAAKSPVNSPKDCCWNHITSPNLMVVYIYIYIHMYIYIYVYILILYSLYFQIYPPVSQTCQWERNGRNPGATNHRTIMGGGSSMPRLMTPEGRSSKNIHSWYWNTMNYR